VDGGQDHVQLGQHLVGEVERAVGQDVALGAGQDPDAVAGLERPDLPELLAELLGAEAAGDRRRAGMVGDDDVLVAARLRGGDQRLERVVAVRPVGVRVEVAPDVADLEQRREAPRQGGLDLPSVLAQLGGDLGEPDRRVDLRLRPPGDPAPPLLEDAVLADLELPTDR
jgi:hypothetical protein